MKDIEKNLSRNSELDGIGQRIRICRKTLKLQQKVMAQSLGISASYFNEIELGKSIAGGEILQKLSKIYNMSVEYIVTGKGELFTNQQKPKPQSKSVKDEVTLDNNIDTVEKLMELIRISSYARLSILLYATTLVLEQGDNIRKTLKSSPDMDD
jgi:transcriptional regulator with XRE-family HTH domain